MDPEPKIDSINSFKSQVDNDNPIPLKSEVAQEPEWLPIYKNNYIPLKSEVDLEAEFLPIYKALNRVITDYDSDDPMSRAHVEAQIEVVRNGFGILGKALEGDEIRRYTVLSRLSTLAQDTRYPHVSLMAREFLTQRLDFIGGLIDPTNTNAVDNTQILLTITNLYDPLGTASEHDMPINAILKKT